MLRLWPAVVGGALVMVGLGLIALSTPLPVESTLGVLGGATFAAGCALLVGRFVGFAKLYRFLRWQLGLDVGEFSANSARAHCARAYFELIDTEYRLLPPAPETTDPNRKEAQAIRERVTNPGGTIRMQDVLDFERVVARILANDSAQEQLLRRRALLLRERCRQVLTVAEFVAFEAANPVVPADKPIHEVLAYIEALLDVLHHVYVLVPMRETTRTRCSLYVLGWTLVALAIVYLVYRFHKDDKDGIPSIYPVVIAGAIGGFVSVQQRIQSVPPDGDALQRMLTLEHGVPSLFLSASMGMVFAVLFYALLVAGYAPQAHLLPQIGTDFGPTGPPGTFGFETFMKSCGPLTAADYAKLLVWAFLAGFAERLVPDVLNRIARPAR